MTHQQLTYNEQSAKACMMGILYISNILFIPIITMGTNSLYVD